MTTRRRPRAALPKSSGRSPLPWHILLKLTAAALAVYLFWGAVMGVFDTLLSLLLLLAFAGLAFAVFVGSFKISLTGKGGREEEHWHEENDPRGNGRGIL